MMKKGSAYTNLLHSVAQFVGDPFNYTEHHQDYIGFVGDKIRGENPHAVVIHDDACLGAFLGDRTNIGKMYVKASGDDVAKADTPMLLLIPAGLVLVEWLASA